MTADSPGFDEFSAEDEFSPEAEAEAAGVAGQVEAGQVDAEVWASIWTEALAAFGDAPVVSPTDDEEDTGLGGRSVCPP